MQVVIVESPAKAKTINKYLGSDYTVLASYGHIRDLPPKDGSVDTEHDFAMKWELYADKSKQLKAIADEVKRADSVILATDPDREGEAISWHLLEWLKGKKAVPKGGATRVTFNEITKTAVLAAMKKPRELDAALIDAYKARRALDYLVGFTLSPVLWRKLPGAKSAGRVQSVALRIVVDREREIEAFRAREYWTIDAGLTSAGGQAFTARLSLLNGKKTDKFDLTNEAEANNARSAVEGSTFTVAAVETKPVSRNPYPPFTTSTLQQEASRKLGFTASHTMRVAQGLYEEGIITYMRTDGVQIAGEAITAARDTILREFGAEALPDKPRHYATKAKNAQEAHEAIRPTDMARRSAGSGDTAKLYELIWKRTIASQMASARMERTSVELLSDDRQTGLRASGQVILSPGFLAVYTETRDDTPVSGAEDDDDSRRLPRLTQGEKPRLDSVKADQHFTEPPPRFSEATLVKKLEELGIGRPSTYASILQTLRDRSYVRMEKNRFFAEEKGRLVTAFLERFFEKYVGYDFTAELETELDEVSAGDLDYLTVLGRFWAEFQAKTKEILELRPSDVTVALDEFLSPFLFPPTADGSDPRLCPTCGNGRLSLKTGKFGAFVACSNYPECRYTRQFAAEGGEPQVGNGVPVLLGEDSATGEPVSLRSGRFGAYVQRGEDGEKGAPKPPRASIPKDMAVTGPEDLETALKLLSLPREVGIHPESGEKITASIGRYGPYLAHNGKYARLTSSAEVFETGMNSAVVKLAEALANPGRARNAPVPLRELGPHPVSGAVIKLIEGRFGPYLTDGTTNANVPKGSDGLAISLDEAAGLIDTRAAMPSKGKKPVKKKAAPAKAAPKATAAKKPAAKKAPAAKKPAAKAKVAAKA
ncbi:type I DNA topoisomerase [Glacieibacterium sp.]|uniref:type I DNA topoisomerase n=1 Tax=Glacieibacterium sp. TaxID=2860237 RepID=UPI003B00136B